MENREEKILGSLADRAERIRKAGMAGSTPMAEECRRRVTIEQYNTIPEAMAAGRGKGPKPADGWKKTKVSWKSCTYMKAEFRESVTAFEKDRNLSRFIWRTAKTNGMKEITLSDVQKMIEAADETIWILGGEHAFLAEDPDRRAPTWVMEIDRKKMYGAMMRIRDAGWAETDLRDITIRGEKMQQRVWTLKEGA